MSTVDLRNADCLAAMRAMPDNSVDVVLTDPPYGLGNTTAAQVTETIIAWTTGDREFLPGGRGFMGKAWDAFVPPVAVWDEAMRVLKPGGHMAVFSGARTVDLMGLAIRLAGFEIRDVISWIYATGFPKSMDVSKAIDKQRDDQADVRAVCEWLAAKRDAAGLTNEDLDAACGLNTDGASASHWTAGPAYKQPRVPKLSQWATLKDVLDLGDEMDAEVWRLNGRKGTPGEAWNQREVLSSTTTTVQAGGSWERESTGGMFAAGDKVIKITAPATDAAKAWAGFGTALKPAHEPIILARKPLAAGTVAANVLEYGTGALNIDASRIGTETLINPPGGIKSGANNFIGGGKLDRDRPASVVTGRFPANVILDESQAEALDAQSGITKSTGGSGAKSRGALGKSVFGDYTDNGKPLANAGGLGDYGGASRFFYVAKAGKKERPVVDGVAHPTVKPISLMRYLARLITPPGGVVLEPFAGSGTTVEACILEGFDVIAIERDPSYIPLIQARIDRATITEEMEAAA